MIQFESQGFSVETINELTRRGHKHKFRASIGEANCIQVNGELIFGSADSRKGAIAVGY